MITTLFRQDPAIRSLGPVLLVGCLVGWFLRSLAQLLPRSLEPGLGEGRGWVLLVTALVVFTALTVMFQQNFLTRASRMALGLPIAARSLWRVRITSILLTSVLPVVVVTLIAASGSADDTRRFLLLSGLRGCATLLLAAFLFQCLDADLHKVRGGGEIVVYVVMLSGAAMLYVLLAPASWISVLVPVVAATAAALWIHAHTPPAYLLARTENLPLPESPPASSAIPTHTTPTQDSLASKPAQEVDRSEIAKTTQVDETGGRWVLRRTIFSVLVNHWLNWMIAGGCVFIAAATVASYHTGENPMPHLIISLLWPVAILEQAVIRLHRLDTLPIPRGRLFFTVILTLVLPMLIGAGLVGIGRFGPRESYQVQVSGSGLQIPPEAWEISPAGQVPLITAPWGETFQPRAHPLYPGSSRVVYRPYAFGADNSNQFRALQAHRAVRAVHGSSPYLDEEFTIADGKNDLLLAIANREPDGEEFPVPGSAGQPSPARNRVYAVGLGAMILWSTLFWSLNLLRRHPRVARWLGRVLYFGLFGLVAAYYLVTIVEDLAGFSEALLVLPAIILRRLAGLIPFATPVLWLVNLPLALGCYWLMRGLFGAIEAPTGEIKPIWKEYG